ncbi:MAG TPA: hypothetical protein VMV69_03795 [Pirellulales bacterium]|nr:hypothetical protein [Pirellulales bacterium]
MPAPHREIEVVLNERCSVSSASMTLLLPVPLLPMKTVSGVSFNEPLSRIALKLRIRTLCKI